MCLLLLGSYAAVMGAYTAFTIRAIVAVWLPRLQE
jgi:hypothetical protein